MSSGPVGDGAGEARAADDVRSAPGWWRTGLVLGWGAVASAAGGLLTALPDPAEPGTATAVLWLTGLVLGLVATAFLRRAWSVPGLVDDPAVVRARGWCDVALVAWGTSIVLRFVLGDLLDAGGTWLTVLGGLLGTVFVVAYVGMLVLATRRRPEQSPRRDQL
ncbi:hypothetical protein [Blastococcus goldschmidtiae]|uniref:DUF3180 domain-containing protein n=1 Tax=Blastococcus goldschmidtiae TaxID=3075546 RepID=A0ABU2K6R2_9ACTN|nr:hypothetical protein [Blastococcus sp. DSM 46792]MDT0275851.1 hypothetical protein [Blastococcus sp. DSM 46792]